MGNIIQAVSSHLFTSVGTSVFAVMDGASVPNLLSNLYQHEPEFVCLYRGELEPDMAEVAPYLIRLDQPSEFTNWVIGRGWGNHWGIFAVSQADIRIMRHHFRTFLMVYDSDNKPIYFRYYDPRVLRVYLPTCNTEELRMVFGPVEYYLFENDDTNIALRYRMSSGVLQPEKLRLATGTGV